MDLNPSKRTPLTIRAHNLNALGSNSITNTSDSVDPSKEKKLLKCDSSAENEKKSTADLSTENNKESTINSCIENKSKPANDLSENNKELTVNSTENNKESSVNSSTENSKVKGPLTPKSQRRASETIMQKIDSLNAAIELSHSPPPQRKFQKGNCVLDSKKYEENDNDVFSDNKVAEEAKTECSPQTRKPCNSMEETKNSLSEEVRENKDTENENSMKLNDNEVNPSNSSCTENLDRNSMSETSKVANGAIEDKIVSLVSFLYHLSLNEEPFSM